MLAALAAARARRARRSSASPPSTATGAVERGRAKLERKGLDAVVVNDISRADIGFDAPDNEVTIVTAEGERHVPRAQAGRGGGDPRRGGGAADSAGAPSTVRAD